jgi:hypothetical protein
VDRVDPELRRHRHACPTAVLLLVGQPVDGELVVSLAGGGDHRAVHHHDDGQHHDGC